MIRQTSKALSNMLILSEADVRQCFNVSTAISANRKALASLRENGGATVPDRIGLPYHPSSSSSTASASSSSSSISPADWSLFKPAAYYPPQQSHDDDILMGMKLVSMRANNPTKFNKPTVVATTMLCDAETGEVSAVVAATYLTAVRTAAGSALATELALLNHGKATDGVTLLVFGAGLQAELHVQSIQHVVNVSRVAIVNRSLERAEKLKEKLLSEQHIDPHAKTQVPITDIRTILLSNEKGVRDAVKDADVIATTTNTSTPLFPGEWLKGGCHVNGVGSYTPLMQEVDGALVNRCEVLIDTKEALDVGDLACLKVRKDNEIGISSNYVGLIGDALVGNIEFGRQRDDGSNNIIDCTFYKSVGTAIQDVVSAHVAIENATKNKIGLNVEM